MAKNTAGFTLLELLIVVSLSIMLMLAASSLFMTFLIGSAKTSTNQLIKNEGDYALDQISFLIRNAVDLTANQAGQTCENNMVSLGLRSQDSGVTVLAKEQDTNDQKFKIASNSGIYLTSGGVEITNGPIFNCQANDTKTSQYVSVTFTLRKGTPGVDKPRDIVEQTFTTSAMVRSY